MNTTSLSLFVPLPLRMMDVLTTPRPSLGVPSSLVVPSEPPEKDTPKANEFVKTFFGNRKLVISETTEVRSLFDALSTVVASRLLASLDWRTRLWAASPIAI